MLVTILVIAILVLLIIVGFAVYGICDRLDRIEDKLDVIIDKGPRRPWQDDEP